MQKDPPKPWLRRIAAYRLLHVLGLGTLLADQVSKWAIARTLPFGTWHPSESITVIPGFFYLTHVGNTGAAWSMLSGRSTLLASIAILTLLGIFLWRRALGLRDRLVQIAFGLLLGGIIGNLVDRLRLGHVIDFFDFHFGSYVYPTFNVADAGICIGVGLYMWHSLRQQKN